MSYIIKTVVRSSDFISQRVICWSFLGLSKFHATLAVFVRTIRNRRRKDNRKEENCCSNVPDLIAAIHEDDLDNTNNIIENIL